MIDFHLMILNTLVTGIKMNKDPWKTSKKEKNEITTRTYFAIVEKF